MENVGESHGARKDFRRGNMGCELERVANRELGYRPYPRVAMGRIALVSTIASLHPDLYLLYKRIPRMNIIDPDIRTAMISFAIRFHILERALFQTPRYQYHP